MEMTAKEYLMQYRIAINRIKRKQEQIDRFRADMLPRGISYDGMPGKTGEKTYADTLARIDELERKLLADKQAAMQIAECVMSAIERVEDDKQRAILHDRYILGMKWEEIGKKRNTDLRWLHRLHNKALQRVEKIIN